MGKVNVEEKIDEMKDVVNLAVEEVKQAASNLVDEVNNTIAEKEETEECRDIEIDEFEGGNYECEVDSDVDNESCVEETAKKCKKKKTKISKSVKYVVAAGIGVAVVGAGVVIHRNTTKTACHLVRAIM